MRRQYIRFNLFPSLLRDFLSQQVDVIRLGDEPENLIPLMAFYVDGDSDLRRDRSRATSVQGDDVADDMLRFVGARESPSHVYKRL